MTKQNNGWISVEERLPENNQVVLGYHPMYIFICKKLKDRFVVKMNLTPCDITHWQPLPQPPKDVKNE